MSPLLAFVVSLILHWGALRLFPGLGLLDFPKRYGYTRSPIPYPTGIVAVLLFLAFFVYLEPSSLQKTGLIIGILLLGITCFIDDRRPLPSLIRGWIQLLTALLVFASGTRIYTLTNPLEDFGIMGDVIKLDTIDVIIPGLGPLPVLSGIFTIIWLGLTINALNWFDGIPGQVNVLSVIAFITIGLLSLSSRVNQPALALIAFVLAGIAGGSLLFSFPPPRMLIGDTGAMFYGLMIGVLTIYSGGKVATAFLVLGVPLIDSVIVVFRRIRKKTSPLRGNAHNEHLHHRLMAKSWSQTQVLLLTAILGSVFGLTALFLSTTQKFIAAMILFAIMIGLSWYSAPRQGASV
jgi:UDP-GlcNAc:undecaprenyl-phosphate GlcNAc-1-phosphate transferase